MNTERILNLDTIRISTQIALVSFGSYWLGFHSSGLLHAQSASIGGLWAAISGIVVLQSTRNETVSSAWLRVLGTAIGAAISAVYLFVLPFSALGMAVSIFATVLLCNAVRIPSHARLAASSVAVIMVTASLHPTLNPVFNAALRLLESFIGVAVAVFVILIWSKRRLNADGKGGER
jgi:uncharacterized membrane protein YgaE (UPF0421/DUF939 family)